MNEEELKAVETLEHWVEYEKANKDKINKADELIQVQETILNLIEKQQEEIENSISKDKIRDKIKEYRTRGTYSYWEEIMALEELLEE